MEVWSLNRRNFVQRRREAVSKPEETNHSVICMNARCAGTSVGDVYSLSQNVEHVHIRHIHLWFDDDHSVHVFV